MKYLNKLIGGNVLLKVTSMNSVGVGIQLITGLVVSKALAVFVGPQGLALIGNLRNLLSPVQQKGILEMYNGVVKYAAEFKENKEELKKLLSTSFFSGAAATLVMALIVFFNADYLNTLIFEGYSFTMVIKGLAIALPFYSLNLYCLAIVNGFERYKMYVILNAVTNVLGMFVTLILVWQQQLLGALIAIILVPALSLLITLVLITNRQSFIKLLSIEAISGLYVKKLGSFAIMQLVSAILIPVVMIAIRSEIIDVQDTKAAGYWEAINRISSYYMMFFTSLMTIYILPKLSSITTDTEFRFEILNFYKKVLPFFAVGMVAIYVLKIVVIRVVFTKAFLPMQDLFFWQLLGDLLKIMSVVIAYQMLAKNMFWHYIITELISIAIIYKSSMYFVDQHGFVGASMAHLFSYVCYFLVMLFVFRKPLFNIKH